MRTAASTGHHDALFGGPGDVRRECRALDWTSHPLGPPSGWPAALRHGFSLLLGSRFPMFIAWGPARSFLYNDAYADLLGERHPGALGKPIQVVWPDLWPQVKPLIERAFAGESFLGEDVRRRFERANGHYDSTFTLSYSPVLLDDGSVGGAFCAIVETTAHRKIQRRREFQLELADRLRPLTRTADVVRHATSMLAEHLSLSRAAYREHVHLDQTVVLSSVDRASPWYREGAGAVIAVPVGPQGARTHALIAVDAAPRNWTEDEIALLQEAAERVWNAVKRTDAEQERARAEERLHEGMLAARMIVWEWELATGKADFSDNACDMLGFRVEHMDQLWARIAAQDVARLRRAHADAVDSAGTYQEVVRYQRPDTGESFWFDVRGKVRRDAQGTPVAMRGVAVDITTRMRTQVGLERAEARQAFQLNLTDRLRALSDPAHIFRTTSELVGRQLGACRVMCGNYDATQGTVSYHANYTAGAVPALEGAYPASDLGAANFASIETGATWASHDTRHDPRTCAPDLWPGFERIGSYATIIIPHTRHGALLACLFVVSSVPRRWQPEEIALARDAAGRMWNAIERVRAEDALMLADRRKDQFLAMLAHELRNPLAPISAAAELLKLPGVPAARVASTAEVVARQVRHMTGLVDDLLDVSRVTSGMVGLEIGNVDMKQVVADAVEQVRPLVEARHHHCTVEMSSAPALVEGDYKRLVQVLANLLNNAAKYTPEGGTLKVTLENGARQVVLRVVDNGMGMAPELLPHVFELFSQAERTPDRAQGGLGIGLALVRSLVELHGGTVAALSDGPGSGSEFVVRLPPAPAGELETGPAATQQAGEAGVTRRVLLVDDNVDAAQMLAMYLEACGHEVTVRHHPGDALALAAYTPFDAFLLDIGLPGMDGHELARRLRQSTFAPDALIAAITGYGQQADKELAVEAGFDHFFVKPVDPRKIAAVLSGGHEGF